MARLMRLDATQRRKLAWQYLALSLLLVLLIGLGSTLQRRASQSVAALRQGAATARQQMGAVTMVLERLLDAETGQRGFILTRKPAYLEPFEHANQTIGPFLSVLRASSAGTASLRDDVGALTALADAKLQELQETITLTQAGDIAGALAIIDTDRGKNLMDDVRLRVTHITTQLEQEDQQQSKLLWERQARLALGTQVAIDAGVLALGLALALVLLNRARLAATQQAERLVGERLAAAINRLRDAMAVFDTGGTLILRSDRLATVLNLQPEQVRLGQSWDAIVAAANLPALSTLPNTTAEPVEAMLGGRTLELWQGTMPDGSRILAVADISGRVAAEELARQAQKMEALGQMTGGVAHEFNNLLQVVSANLELAGNRLARSAVPDPWIQTRLDAARSGVVRGATLTRHLLAFARRQPLAPESIAPGRLLAGMENQLQRTVGGAIGLELIINDGLWAVRADPKQLEDAISSLVLNARDAIVARGIAHGCLSVEAANDVAYVGTRQKIASGTHVVFSVTDNGTGMTPEQLERATEPFYTTKPEGQGTGLGLSMVFGFAIQSGGHFVLNSGLGRGTTAKLYLPRTDIPAAAASVPTRLAAAGGRVGTGAAASGRAGTGAANSGRGETILLVDNDATVRATGAEVLRSLGYAVVDAMSADAALRLVEQGLRPDLLLTDVVMPGRVPNTAAGALLMEIPVLFTSGHTRNATGHGIIPGGGALDQVVPLISKPWQPEELARELRQALDQPRVAPPAPLPATVRTVLLVEDEPLVRMTTADTLSDLGYRVLEAATAREALAQARHADLILLDLGLPDMPGLELAETLRAARPTVRIVIASGQEHPAPGYDWLPKPYDTVALTTALARAWSNPP